MVVEQLITRQVRPRHGVTTAINNGRLAALEMLVAAGGDPTCPGERADALPYDSVVKNNDLAMMRFLMRYPVPLTQTDDRGRTLLAIARDLGHHEMADLLERAGVSVALDRTAEVVARWRAALARHRRDWLEWRMLETIAHEDGWAWSVVRGNDYLVRRDRTLSVCVLIDGAKATPAYATPLCELRPGDVSDHAGGVAAWTTLGLVTRANARDLCPGAESPSVRFPAGGLQALQTNRSGRLIGVDGAGDAIGFTGHTFERIGTAEHLLRYCMRETLAGRPWDDAFYRGTDLTEHQLTAIALRD